MVRFLRHFCHQYDVGRRIDVNKSARVVVELVSQDEYEVAAAFHGLRSSASLPLTRRHLMEQCPHGLSVDLPEFQDGRDQADKQDPEYEGAQDQKLVGAHLFLTPSRLPA